MSILTVFRHRFYNNDGTLAAGGKVYTYQAGTTTAKATYTDYTGVVANSNPIILDSKGEASIWTSGLLKINVTQSDDVQITGYPVDYVGQGQSSYDISQYISGKPTNSQEVLRFPAARAFTFDINLTSSQAKARVAATATTTFNIAKNDVNIGTMVFAAGATVATFVMAVPPAFAIGDWLTVTNQASADATLADIGFIFVASVTA